MDYKLSLCVLAIFFLATFTASAQQIEKLKPITGPVIKPMKPLLNKTRIQYIIKAKTNVKKFVKEKLKAAIDKCEALGIKECKQKISTRLKAVEKLPKKALAALKIVQQKRKTIKEKLKQLKSKKIFKKFFIYKAGEAKARIVKQKKSFEQKYALLKQEYKKSRDYVKETLMKYKQAKEVLANCENETQCEELRKKVKENAIEFIKRTLELIRKHLERIKTKIESSESITDEEAEKLLEDVNAKLSKVEELEQKAENLSLDSSKEEILALARDVAELWKNELVVGVKHVAHMVRAEKLGAVYMRLQKLADKFEGILQKLAEQGKDITNARNALDGYEQELESARQLYEEAIGRYKEAWGLSGEEKASKIAEAHSMLAEAWQHVKNAYGYMKDIVSEINAMKASLEEDEADEAVESVESLTTGEEKIVTKISGNQAKVTVVTPDVQTTFTTSTTDIKQLEEEITQKTGLSSEKVKELLEVEMA